MVETITQKTKGKTKERPKTHNLQKPRKEENYLLVLRSYLTHNPSNVASMQIVKSNSNRRSRINISHQCNLPLYSRS
jgi:hypothetical protein